MSKHSLPLLSFFAALILVGAGCFGGGGSGIDGSTDGGVWKSIDAGTTWQQMAAVPTAAGVSSAAGTSILSLATDPSDTQAIYAGTDRDGLLFSYDAGVSWQQSRDANARIGAVTAIVVDPTNKCRVYIARGDRILRSEDCNRSYAEEVYIETKSGVIITAMTVDWFQPDTLYATLSDGSILKSTDRGGNWSNIFRGRQAVTSFLVSQADSRVLLAGMAGAGMARSDDGGATWGLVLDPLRPYRDATRVVALSQDGLGNAIYASTYYGILRSFDLGLTWEPLNLLTAPNEVIPSTVLIDPIRPNVIFYSVGNSVYRSQDGGSNWSVQKLPTTRTVSSMLFDRANSNILYLGLHRVE